MRRGVRAEVAERQFVRRMFSTAIMSMRSTASMLLNATPRREDGIRLREQLLIAKERVDPP